MAFAVFYGVAFVLAVVAASKGRGNVSLLFIIFVTGVIISISRQDLNTGDLPVYVEGFAEEEWTEYYLREAPFWLVCRLLARIFPEHWMVFTFIDLLLVFLMTRLLGGTISWQLVILLLAFPTVLGFTNIYRQLISSVIMMAALVEFARSSRHGIWISVLGCSVHVAMIGLCLALLTVHLIQRHGWSFMFFPIIFLGLLPFSNNFSLLEISGGTESRSDTSLLYIVVGLCIFSIAWWHFRHTPLLRRLCLGLMLFFVTGAISLGYAPASTGTRVMMIAIYLTSFLLLARLRTSRSSAPTTLTMAGLLIGPMVISDSAWHLMFGYEIN